MQTIRLVYSSVGQPNLDYEALTNILRVAQAHNEAHGITGVLCFAGGHFVQALEGDRKAVNALYHRIAGDRRHTDCQILQCESIHTRSFVEWSMKLIGWEDAPTAQRRALLLRHSGSATFDPNGMSGEQVLGFLEDLAELERRKAA